MAHKSREVLENELKEARTKIVVGGTYAHYKDPKHFVRVTTLGFQEAIDKLCVVYQDLSNRNLIFVRDLTFGSRSR